MAPPPFSARLVATVLAFVNLDSILQAQTPAPPESMDKRLTVELVAAEPDLRTPTAIVCDAAGRVFVLENNTHFRPKTYAAPETDRIILLEDFGPDGKAGKITTWADGFRDGMGLLLLPGGELIVATRSVVIELHDTDRDGTADRRKTLLKMETKANYPHNGLSGLAMGPDRKVYLGLGENFGNEWKLTGTDGSKVEGADEGAVFRFNPDGTKLEWWALGVWNPFGLAVRPDGQLFALDNDPSGGSLCRLLHIVRGGDYGFRMRYGRTIDHPFLSWFGQIPGTLPPVSLVGEAPCGMLAYTAGGPHAWPAEYHGELIGTTWSEHGLQRYPLTAYGASYKSTPGWVIRGGRDFRPSGVAQAPDGSVFITDWVDGSYEVHGKGRVWRVRGSGVSGPAPAIQPAQTEANGLLGKLISGKSNIETARANFTSTDPFLFHAANVFLTEQSPKAELLKMGGTGTPEERLAALLALRRSENKDALKLLPEWLRDADGAIRRAALQWISEEELKQFQPELEKALTGQPSRPTFQAYLAAIQMLTSGKPDPKATVNQTVQLALDGKRAPELRALALRLAPPPAAELNVDKLKSLLQEKSTSLRVEAIRILGARPGDDAQAALREIAADASAPPGVRAEAAAGLVHSASTTETGKVLRALETSGDPMLAREARRSLGTHLTVLSAEPKGNPLEGDGNVAAGRRIFYHPNGPRCYTCHTIEGRGIAIGPDLTQMGRFTAEEVLAAIREPSKDVAPAYAQFHLKKKDGTEALGIDLFEDNKSQVTLLDATGQRTKHNFSDLVSREVLPISMMPPGLDAMLTTEELRDLIAYLRENRE
jgi:putative membrane-bound dehydrogenase-like protein